MEFGWRWLTDRIALQSISDSLPLISCESHPLISPTSYISCKRFWQRGVMLHCQFGVRKVRTSKCSVHWVKSTLSKRHMLIHSSHTKSWGSFTLDTLIPIHVLYKVRIVSYMVFLWADGPIEFLRWIFKINLLSIILNNVRYLYGFLDHLLYELTYTLLIGITHFFISCFDSPHCSKLTLLYTFQIFLSRHPFFVLIDVVHFYFIYL